MKFVFAPDSMKGSMTSWEEIRILESTARKYFPGCEIVSFPMADGGEGTIEALMQVLDGVHREVQVHNPLYEEMTAFYSVLRGGTVLVEMAAASGLTLIPFEEGNAIEATSYGTGELIRHALENGYHNFIIAIGGSATNDGGMGAMAALGARFLDSAGEELFPAGKNLIKVDQIDVSGMMPELSEAHFTVMCDVNNPMTGPEGATFVFGPQKGGVGSQLTLLEMGMKKYAELLRRDLNKDVEEFPGAGAAGGMGGAMLAFCNARLMSGIQVVLETIHFAEHIADADMIITGEGRVDEQSLYGKVLSGIGMVAKEQNVLVTAIVGGFGEGYEGIYDCGIDNVIPLMNDEMTLTYAMGHASYLYEAAADKLFSWLKAEREVEE